MREGQIYEAALQGDEADLADFLKAIRAINSDKKEEVIAIKKGSNADGDTVTFTIGKELLYVCDAPEDRFSLSAPALPYPFRHFEESVDSIFSDARIRNVHVSAEGALDFLLWVGKGTRIVRHIDLAHMPITLQITVPVRELLIFDGADRFYQLLQSAAVLSYSGRPGVLLPSATRRQTHHPLRWLARAASAFVPRPLADSGCIPACTRNIARTKPVGFDIADFQIDPPYRDSSYLIRLLMILDWVAFKFPFAVLYACSCACCADCAYKVTALKEQLFFERETTQRYQQNGEVNNLTTVTYGYRCFFARKSQLFRNSIEGEGAPMLGDQRNEGEASGERPNYGVVDDGQPGGPPRQRMWDIEGRISPGAGLR